MLARNTVTNAVDSWKEAAELLEADDAVSQNKNGSVPVKEIPVPIFRGKADGPKAPGDDVLKQMAEKDIKALYEHLRKVAPKEANKVKRMLKIRGLRASSLMRSSKKLARKAGKIVEILPPLLFLADWYLHGFSEASRSELNDDFDGPARLIWDILN